MLKPGSRRSGFCILPLVGCRFARINLSQILHSDVNRLIHTYKFPFRTNEPYYAIDVELFLFSPLSFLLRRIYGRGCKKKKIKKLESGVNFQCIK
jgi:hypothetical protein